MPYELKDRLVIGLASSALFNLDESDRVFKEMGEDTYREYQRKHQHDVLDVGVAYPFIKRLLRLNSLRPEDPLIEVVLLSRNDPDTGLRVMKSIEHYDLGISRAIFLQGESPHSYLKPLDIELFLSANEHDVKQAIKQGDPAGQVLESCFEDDEDDRVLRIAFDFDGVIADDSSESVYQKKDIKAFHKHEKERADIPCNAGPLLGFLEKIAHIQKLEREERVKNRAYEPRLQISIVTARSAPAHERVINTMRSWNIHVDKAFFLGGIEKRKVLEVLRPHIFFDDQKLHLKEASAILPAVHIPFGITNT